MYHPVQTIDGRSGCFTTNCDGFLVATEWLAEHLHDSSVHVVDVRGSVPPWRRGRIPGAGQRCARRPRRAGNADMAVDGRTRRDLRRGGSVAGPAILTYYNGGVAAMTAMFGLAMAGYYWPDGTDFASRLSSSGTCRTSASGMGSKE